MTDTSRLTGDTIELLGLVGYVSLASVGWIADCHVTAPSLLSQLKAVELMGDEAGHLTRVQTRVNELGGDGVAAVSLYDGLLTDFEARTPARNWWEGLVKVYVTDGILRDYCLMAAPGLSEGDQELVTSVLTPSGAAEWFSEQVAIQAGQDSVLASRLALWGRRLVGEALGVVQHLEERPSLAGLVAAATTGDRSQSTVFAHLTAEHTRRMSRLSLAA